jgi:hypothetical protein
MVDGSEMATTPAVSGQGLLRDHERDRASRSGGRLLAFASDRGRLTPLDIYRLALTRRVNG